MDGDGLPVTLMGTEVIVTRNPCLHPGDLQKFKLAQRRELSHLIDCVVFSTKGKRPAADLMSGGDLDGDTFFVSWDEKIIPSTVSQAAEYPGAREPVSFKPITDDDRLLYFAKYTNASLGKVKNLYLSWARSSGPMSLQCQELNRLFSTCVDGNRIKIPPKLETPPEPSPEVAPFILDQLHEAAVEMIRYRDRNAAAAKLDCDGYSFEAVEMLLSRDDFAISEYELMQLTHRWCLRNGVSLEDFVQFFNFTHLTAEEKAWTLSQLPVTQGYPSLVRNALCQSDLLEQSELYDFKLHYSCLQWKCFYTSSRDRLAVFFDKATKALEIFHRKLIVLRVDERLTIAIYIPQQIPSSTDCKIGNKARLFAFPHSKGRETSSRLSLPTKMNYQVYCDSNVFQLFDGRRQNTWVFIGRGASDESTYQNLKVESDRRRTRQASVDSGVNFDCRASIALDKFSRGLQTHEIYIISNRDVHSLRNLDLWLEYVDTREEVPLFERNAREYKKPTVREVDWKTQPDYIAHVVLRKDFTGLLGLETRDQFAKLFCWLLERDEKELLLHSFNFLLGSFEKESFGAVRSDLVFGEMLNFLGQCPFLAVAFSQVEWAVLPAQLTDVLDTRVEDILRAMIVSANTVDQMMLSPFMQILASARVLSISVYARLVEMIALTVRSPSLALDILLCGLERESARLIPERPALIRHLLRSLTGIAIEHVEEAAEQRRESPGLLSLRRLHDTDDGWPVVQADFRLDAKGGTPKASTHLHRHRRTLSQ
ncbi:putative RNA-dependent RNA polymerase 1 [Colletotrichum liriopes]|uniref:RNA-dependent RNA polymerase n=1 Tax=Colletotrichum liriopes TaxID=708192 RepID=A0AA37H144_9PEZI|nr:putative RNA-dependent RNA polymerase 1 [Colletotrichum liriopes]